MAGTFIRNVINGRVFNGKCHYWQGLLWKISLMAETFMGSVINGRDFCGKCH